MAADVAVCSHFTVFGEIAAALGQLGLTVAGFADADALQRLLAAAPPRLVLDVNFHADLHAVAAASGVPYSVWSFDSKVADAVSAAGAALRPVDRFYLFNRSEAEQLRRRHEPVVFLPFSAGDCFIRSPRREGFTADVLLVMNSYRETALRAEADFAAAVDRASDPSSRQLLELARALGELAVDRHLDDCDRYRMDEFLAADIAGCGVDPWCGDLAARGRFCRGFGQILSFRQRERCLRLLAAAGFRVTVYGDAFWSAAAAEFPRVTYCGPAAYDRLPDLYCRARVAINLTQVQNLDSVPQRIYHLLAAGTAAVSNGAAALAEFFTPGRQLETFSSLEEMVEKVRLLLADEDRRAEIARAGHGEFLSRHRMVDRLRPICADAGLPTVAH